MTRNKRQIALVATIISGVCCVLLFTAHAREASHSPSSHPQAETSVLDEGKEEAVRDSLALAHADSLRYLELTDADFEKVAKELDVEPAAIKAVVSIEAGPKMKGFWAPGVPLINFDATMYNKFKNKVADRSGLKEASVPEGLTGQALTQWRKLTNARRQNYQGANMGTFWGMFQIGGFNYKLCGCESVDQFVERMSYSELEQLELFAAFVKNTGLVNDIRQKNWARFARRYNGPSYAKRGYHTKMANAYKRFSKL